MSIDILSMLQGVRDSGGGNYMARCPAHNDRSPSLSVRLCDDRRILLNCFAGCSVESVCSALDLSLADLMPKQPIDHRVRPARKTMPAREALISLDHESLVVYVIAADVLQHRILDQDVFARLAKAVSRIGLARDAVSSARYRP